MQFRGHFLPVHQPMSVSWAFTLSHFVSQSAYAISFDYWPLECVTSFRCITLESHVWPGRRSIYNILLSPLFLYRPKRCGNNNKDEDISPKTLNDKSHQASSQKFRHCLLNLKPAEFFVRIFLFKIKKNKHDIGCCFS